MPRGKERVFPTCASCRPDRIAPSLGRISPGDASVREFYVHVLQHQDVGFFAGCTCDIKVRLMEPRDVEPRDVLIHATAGRSPKLVKH